jgi:hypothetical protein
MSGYAVSRRVHLTLACTNRFHFLLHMQLELKFLGFLEHGPNTKQTRNHSRHKRFLYTQSSDWPWGQLSLLCEMCQGYYG